MNRKAGTPQCNLGIQIYKVRVTIHVPMSELYARNTDRRLGGESNREIVSCRAVCAYVRARGAWSSEISAKSSGVPFPFSLWPRRPFPFPLRPIPFPLRPPLPPILLSNFSWLYRYIFSYALKVLELRGHYLSSVHPRPCAEAYNTSHSSKAVGHFKK